MPAPDTRSQDPHDGSSRPSTASTPSRWGAMSSGRSSADTTLGSGIESGVVLVIFTAAGYGVDRWLDTSPIFTLVLFGLGAIGLFYRHKAAYTVRMDELAAQRKRHEAARRAPTTPPARTAPDAGPEPAGGGVADRGTP